MLEKIDTVSLLLGFLGIWFIAYIIAWVGRNEYDFIKSAKRYSLIASVFCIVCLFFQIKWILVIGLFLFGFIILIFRNQHYFDKG